MKKPLTCTLAATAATAALLAIAGSAQAAPAEFNMYGSSAQYLFWNAQARHFAQTELGCTAIPSVNNGRKHGFISATNCRSTLVPVNTATGKRDLDIRYSGIASAEGLLAVMKRAPIDITLLRDSTDRWCNQFSGERPMYASSTTTVCKQVHVGISDVAGETLVQSSNGDKFGPVSGPNFVVPMNGVNTSGLTPHSTVEVPFGFFVNSAVTAKQCTAGLKGNYCLANTDCDTAPGNATGTCGAAATIKNISRTQAVQIFSGQAADWSDFGSYFTPQQIVACLRHAGSGTHAALDYTVMNGGGSGWGALLVGLEDKVGAAGKLIDGGAPQIWFNQSSGDEIKCINGNIGTGAGSLIGAIGYADADQAIGVADTSQNVKQLAYNGVYPTRSAIRNGQYEFYTAAQFYTNPEPARAAVNAIAEALVTYAQNPANIPPPMYDWVGILYDMRKYWATAGEMNYVRAADAGYPQFNGAIFPQLP